MIEQVYAEMNDELTKAAINAIATCDDPLMLEVAKTYYNQLGLKAKDVAILKDVCFLFYEDKELVNFPIKCLDDCCVKFCFLPDPELVRGLAHLVLTDVDGVNEWVEYGENHLQGLTSINISGSDLYDATYLRGIREVYVSDTNLVNLDQLSEAKILDLSRTNVIDVSPFVNAEEIMLEETDVSDVSWLANVRKVSLVGCQNVRNIEALNQVETLTMPDGSDVQYGEAVLH